jgi:amidase
MARPHPPITRGLKHTVSKLKAAGVKVIDFQPYNHQEGWDIVKTLYFPDAAQTHLSLLAQGGEPVLELTNWAFSYAKSEPISVADNWDLNVRREAFRAQ